MSNTLDNIKAGDTVILHGSGGEDVTRVVSRTTRTQIMVPGASEGTERAFWRKNGEEVGDRKYARWRSSWTTLHAATPEALAKIERRERRRAALGVLRNADMSKVPLEELENAVTTLMAFGATVRAP